MKTRMTTIAIIFALLLICSPIKGQSGDAAELTNIVINRTDNSLEAALEITGTVNYESFTLFNPNRLIIDLLQVQSFSCEPEIDVNSFGVAKIRTAKNQPDVTRVVFDLGDPIPSYSIEERDSGIVVIIRQEPKVEEAPVEKPARVEEKRPQTIERTTTPPVKQKPAPKPEAAERRAQEDLFADSGERSKRLGIQVGGGLYFVHDNDFQELYGKSSAAFGGGLEFLMPISAKEDVGIALDLNMLSATGTTSYTEEDIKLKWTPFSFTLFYTRHFGRFSPYAGLGIGYFTYKEEYPSTFPISEISGNLVGYNLLLGTNFKLVSSLAAKIFFKLQIAKKTENDIEINLSGNHYGLGLIYYFDF